MNLEAKKKEYQKILVEEYRLNHMEETEGLSNEEIALMCPISENDITFLMSKELMEIGLSIEEQEQELNKIKGNQMNIEFGSQIRSYVMHPYSMVKDHRTNYETSNVTKVLDGNIDEFIESNLKRGL